MSSSTTSTTCQVQPISLLDSVIGSATTLFFRDMKLKRPCKVNQASTLIIKQDLKLSTRLTSCKSSLMRSARSTLKSRRQHLRQTQLDLQEWMQLSWRTRIKKSLNISLHSTSSENKLMSKLNLRLKSTS